MMKAESNETDMNTERTAIERRGESNYVKSEVKATISERGNKNKV